MLAYKELARLHLNFLSLLTEDKQNECLSQLKDINPELYKAIRHKEQEDAEVMHKEEAQENQ